MSASTSDSVDVVLAIDASGIVVTFGGLVALAGVDFSAPAASITGLVGPNGAGKTTLFGVLSGLLRPSEGTVVLGGLDVTRASPQRRAELGLARTFQRIELFGELTVREHLVLARRARVGHHRLWKDLLGLDRWTRDPDEDGAIDSIIEELGLGSDAHRMAASLPLGTGRLVEVGRALASEPSVLLLDEPSSGLDTDETDALAAVLERTCRDRGVAMVLVEHNLDLVLGLCSQICVLDFGRMIATGTPEEIRNDAAVQAAYIGTEVS